jgi:hypothetical protein
MTVVMAGFSRAFLTLTTSLSTTSPLKMSWSSTTLASIAAAIGGKQKQ